jgi:16S rRNA G966 N2-methylase RsmD
VSVLRYLSTFPSGFGRIAETALTGRFLKTTVQKRLDNALEYASDTHPAKIAALRFFQNSFVVVKRFEGSHTTAGMIRFFLKNRLESVCKTIPVFRSADTFRVLSMEGNRPVGMPPDMRNAVESRLRKASGKRESRGGADVELWFSSRSDNIGYILLRFTKRRATEKTLHPGEIRPETANLLILCSEPSHHDVFLDPFCGYGGILLERARSYRADSIHGIDSDQSKIRRLRRVVAGSDFPQIRLEVGDARVLGTVEDGSITRVVTDPPWGVYQKKPSIEPIYAGLLTQLERILTADATVVLLTERSCPLDALVARAGTVFRIHDTLEVLVAGKKATVHTLVRA